MGRNGYFVDLNENGARVLPVKVIEKNKVLLSELSMRILELLAEKPMYPKEVARKLRVQEQKVYYHMRNLEELGIIKVAFSQQKRGILAKYYELEKPGIAILFAEPRYVNKLRLLSSAREDFLRPFVTNGFLNALFVVGSPELHGEHMARARDLPLAANLAMFFATFINEFKFGCVKLDVEVEKKSELKENNLILIGGPAVNSITAKVNKYLPIRFVRKNKFYYAVYSKATRKFYEGENIGIVVKCKSPFNSEKHVLVLAGRRYLGTQASILAFLRHFDEIAKPNKYNRSYLAHVVKGYDRDGDGVIDEVKLVE